MNKQRKLCKLLFAATGSVATIKVPIIIQSILALPADHRNYDFEVHLILTENAKHFLKPSDLPANVKVYDDATEWNAWNQRGDPVLHIELGKIADLMIIAPLDANTLGKIASGISDNLLTCTVRAWNVSKPLLFCPAMNVRMWSHPITAQHITALTSWGYVEVPPVCKVLMCGDLGCGGMAEVHTIVENILMFTDAKFKPVTKK